MVESVAERRLASAEGELLIIEEPELMLTPHQQRHLCELLRRYSERNQVIYSTRAPALLDAVHYNEIVRLDRTSQATSVHRAPQELLTETQRVHLAAEFDHERNEMFFATAVVSSRARRSVSRCRSSFGSSDTTPTLWAYPSSRWAARAT